MCVRERVSVSGRVDGWTSADLIDREEEYDDVERGAADVAEGAVLGEVDEVVREEPDDRVHHALERQREEHQQERLVLQPALPAAQFERGSEETGELLVGGVVVLDRVHRQLRHDEDRREECLQRPVLRRRGEGRRLGHRDRTWSTCSLGQHNNFHATTPARPHFGAKIRPGECSAERRNGHQQQHARTATYGLIEA